MQEKPFFFRYYFHHLLFWLLLGVAWYYLRYQDYRSWQEAAMITLVKVVDLAVLVSLANYLLIPKLLYPKRYLLFVGSLALLIALSSAVKLFLVGTILQDPAVYKWSGNVKDKFYDNVLPHIFLVIAGMAFKLLLDYNAVQKRLLQVARERAEAELSFLKAQINPHFLFNSLNAVYFLIDKNNTEARQALHKFSDMLRYQLYEARDEKISIEKEIGYLQDYIGLQQLRFDNCLVNVTIEPTVKGLQIEPLLLLPFVENSFKHLSHFGGERRNEVHIDLHRRNGEVEFFIRNTTEGKETADDGHGIGLTNVQRRLALLYPRRHQLQVAEENGWFSVRLKLKL